MQDISICARLIDANIAGLKQQYPGWENLLRQCGIRKQDLARLGKRFPIGNAVKLHRMALDVLDDETLGLLDKRTPRGFMRQMALSTVHTRTLDQAVQRIADIANLMENTFRYEVSTRGRDTVLSFITRNELDGDRVFIVGWLMGIIHRLLGWMANERIVPREVSFNFDAPDYHAEYYYAFYGAPISYNCSGLGMAYRTSDLELPIVQTEASVERYVRRYPVDVLIPVEMGGELSREIRLLVIDRLNLNHEMPGIEDIAEHLGAHPRTLRRQLKDERCSYKSITMQVRRDIAMYYLGHGDLSVERIAERAGYADTSSFIRVFKSWTGFTPLAFRKGL